MKTVEIDKELLLEIVEVLGDYELRLRINERYERMRSVKRMLSRIDTLLHEKKDPIIAAVRGKFLQRSEFGLDKYGVGLDRDDLNEAEWLLHFQEELMDATNYIEVLLRRRKETNGK